MLSPDAHLLVHDVALLVAGDDLRLLHALERRHTTLHRALPINFSQYTAATRQLPGTNILLIKCIYMYTVHFGGLTVGLCCTSLTRPKVPVPSVRSFKHSKSNNSPISMSGLAHPVFPPLCHDGPLPAPYGSSTEFSLSLRLSSLCVDTHDGEVLPLVHHGGGRGLVGVCRVGARYPGSAVPPAHAPGALVQAASAVHRSVLRAQTLPTLHLDDEQREREKSTCEQRF